MVGVKLNFLGKKLLYVGLLLIFFISFVSADIEFSISPVVVNESDTTLYNLTVNNSNIGSEANISLISVRIDSFFFDFVVGSNGTDTLSDFSNSTITVDNEDYIYLNWTNVTGYVVNGSSINYFVFNATAVLSGLDKIYVTTVNDTGSVVVSISVEIKSSCDGLSNETCAITSGCAWDDKMFDRCGPDCESYDDMDSCEDFSGYCMWDDMAPEGPECMYMPFYLCYPNMT